jgi:hypothetical protein
MGVKPVMLQCTKNALKSAAAHAICALQHEFGDYDG